MLVVGMQKLRPPHHDVSEMDKTGAPPTKLTSDCKELAARSYKCLEKNSVNAQEICRPEFDAYKACRKAEHTSIIEDRRKRGATLN